MSIYLGISLFYSYYSTYLQYTIDIKTVRLTPDVKN